MYAPTNLYKAGRMSRQTSIYFVNLLLGVKQTTTSFFNVSTLHSTYNQWKRCKRNCSLKARVLVVTKLLNIAINDFDGKKIARKNWVLVTEFVVNGTQSNNQGFWWKFLCVGGGGAGQDSFLKNKTWLSFFQRNPGSAICPDFMACWNIFIAKK